jgi:hypothetical protein
MVAGERRAPFSRFRECIENGKLAESPLTDQTFSHFFPSYVPESFFSKRKFTERVCIFNSKPTKTPILKIRIPEFLTPRRKYEVNETMWLVKFGRPKIKLILRVGKPVALRLANEGVGFGFLVSRWGKRGANALSASGHKMVLFVQWRRMPKVWEVSFVNKMELAESKGIAFPEVLQSYLPSIMGEAPADVFLKWIGKRARQQPKPFAKAASKMFGESAKPIITGLENLADLDGMLRSRMPVDPPYNSLVGAIRAADDEYD